MSIADRLLFLRTALIVIDLTLIYGIYAFGAAELTCQQISGSVFPAHANAGQGAPADNV